MSNRGMTSSVCLTTTRSRVLMDWTARGFCSHPWSRASSGQSLRGPAAPFPRPELPEGHGFGWNATPESHDEVRDQGGSIWLAHPYWSSVNIIRDTLPLQGLAGVEVYNTTTRRHGRAESGVHWDDWMEQEEKLYPRSRMTMPTSWTRKGWTLMVAGQT